jgi:hypothetical protein
VVLTTGALAGLRFEVVDLPLVLRGAFLVALLLPLLLSFLMVLFLLVLVAVALLLLLRRATVALISGGMHFFRLPIVTRTSALPWRIDPSTCSFVVWL